MPDIYIHYGATEFDPRKGFPIHNCKNWNKPYGGLWASRETATFGWIQWCYTAEFRYYEEENSFRFKFRDDASIYRIFTVADLQKLPMQDNMEEWRDYDIDFEQCLRNGIDAIELCYYGKEFNEFNDKPSFSLLGEENLYSALYGWDCDSVVVLNPNSIEVIENA